MNEQEQVTPPAEPTPGPKPRRSFPWRSMGWIFSISAFVILVSVLLFASLHLVKVNLAMQHQLTQVNDSLNTLQTSNDHYQARLATLEQQQEKNAQTVEQMTKKIVSPRDAAPTRTQIQTPILESDFAIKVFLAVFVILFLFILPLMWQLAKFFTSIDFFIYRWKHRAHQTPEQRYALLQKKACDTLIHAASTDNISQLDTAWSIQARKLRKDPIVVACYVDCLWRYPDQTQKIYKLLSRTLSKQLDDVLLKQFMQLDVPHPEKQLVLAEKWLKRFPDHAVLLLALGQICLRCRLWGKARTYFNECLTHQLLPGAFLGLGSLAEETGDFETAMERYREGLNAIVNGRGEYVRSNVCVL
ncbi:MAG: hypothetical protein SFW66_00465 [Gammaproteobacteria bacterium]|nr:hypothetical protein [Gammaproteobacteria bacterium]